MSGKAAYTAAGFSGTGHVAESGASELLAKPEIAARVAELMREFAAKSEIKAERVLREVARIAFADIRLLYDEHGNLKPLNEMDADTAAALASIEIEERGEGGRIRKVRLADKIKALDMLMRHLGLYETDNTQKANPLQALLDLVQDRTTGLAGLGERPILPVKAQRH
jgi:phage terminase small subunit